MSNRTVSGLVPESAREMAQEGAYEEGPRPTGTQRPSAIVLRRADPACGVAGARAGAPPEKAAKGAGASGAQIARQRHRRRPSGVETRIFGATRPGRQRK